MKEVPAQTGVPKDGRARVAAIFLAAFLFACFLFWWLPGVLFEFIGLNNPVRQWFIWISVLAVVAFAAGYLLPPFRLRTEIPQSILGDAERLSWRATLWIAIPALVVAIRFFLYRSTVAYGEGEGLSLLDQAVLYTHLFAGFLYLGCANDRPSNRKRILAASTLVVLPRLIISLHWGRFFLAQAVVPILFLALARGWLRMTTKRWAGLGGLVLVILFVPALVRGDQIFGQDNIVSFFASGGTLRLFQDNADLNLSGRCPPLLVSMTDAIVPYGALGICTVDIWGRKNMPATLDRVLAYNDPSTEGTLEGPGANFLLELYLSGGVAMVILGSVFFGFSNRCFIDWIGRRSLFAGIWAECLSRSLFAPRSTLGYVYERIPSLTLVTLLVAMTIYVARRPWRAPATAPPKGEGGVQNGALTPSER